MVLKKLGNQLQLDKPLTYAMAARVWQAVAGPITIIFLIRSFSLAEQGIYYSLANVLGIQMFFELGLLNILVSQAGRQLASLTTTQGKQRMGILVRSSRRWFAIASVLFTVSAIGFGWNTLAKTTIALEWRLPLVCLVLASAATVAISPLLAILEGAGFREDIYRLRFAQMLTGSLVVWIALSLGLGLWALVLSASVQLLWSAYLPFIYHASFFSQFRQIPTASSDLADSEFSWSRDVVPMQWRFALISTAYYIATQFFTIIIVRYHSEEEAGQFGMTLSVTAAIQALALAWVTTKFSLISAHHGSGNREAAGTMWRRTAVVSTCLLVIALSSATVVIGLLPFAKLNLENRFISQWHFVILAIGCLANHIIAIESFYVLSRGAKPFLFAQLVGFSSTAIAVWVGGYFYATSGVVVGYTLTIGLITLPLHTYAYLKFRREK